MKQLDIIGIVLLLFAASLFLSTYYYHQQVYRHDLRYAQAVTSVTSAFSANEDEPGPYMSSSSGVGTEYNGIFIALITSAVLASLPLITTYLSKLRHGKKPFHLPMAFASATTVVWVLYTTNSIGLFGYA